VNAFVAGIDGGQSTTIAVVGDESGRILGRGAAGAADEVGADGTSTRLRDALREALAGALVAAKLPRETHFAAIVAGVSGYEGRIFGAAPDLAATRFVLMHDAPVAHAGAFGGRPGVIVIAGTGSVVYGTDGVRGRTTGGWGYLFGDEGSAFWLVREALADLMHNEDDVDRLGSPEAQAACEFFSAPTLRHVARAFYGGDIARDRLASFAPRVLAFPRFRDLVERGSGRLAELVGDAVAAGAYPRAACVGGMFSDPGFRTRVYDGIAALGSDIEIVEPAGEPASGALLLAYREAGLAVGGVTA
jgi:N-acetylglucosamine kinase-like BadF-type ATPase